MRGIGRRLRSHFGIGSSRMAIRAQAAWYWRWLLNVLMMAVVAGAVWWIVVNSYRIAGKSVDEATAASTLWINGMSGHPGTKAGAGGFWFPRRIHPLEDIANVVVL